MADVATIFGSINSVIDQTTNSILKIENAQQKYGGYQPSRYVGAFPSTLGLPSYTTAQWIGLAVLGIVLAMGAVVLYREFK